MKIIKRIFIFVFIIISIFLISCNDNKESKTMEKEETKTSVATSQDEKTETKVDTVTKEPTEKTTEEIVKPFIDGKKLVTFGDSITALGTWGKDVASELNMYYFNAAIGGITSAQGIDRFKAIVTGSNADFVTICFGQNDIIMNTYNTPRVTKEEFHDNLVLLVQMTRDINAIPILLTTNPLNPDIFWTAQGQDKENYKEVGYDPLAWLDEYNDVTRSVAIEMDCDFVDMRNEFSEKYYRNTLSDGIHLNARGNEIFKTALLNYFTNLYSNDPDGPKVSDEDLNIYVNTSIHTEIVSFNQDDWYTVDPNVLKFESTDSAIKLYNTNGLWPEAHFTLQNPLVIDYNTGFIYFDIELENVNSSIILFINGSTPAAYQNNEYIVLNSHISDNCDAAGDIVGSGHFVGEIKLTDLYISKSLLNDGKLTISGIKVFVAGMSYQKVTINELSCAIGE